MSNEHLEELERRLTAAAVKSLRRAAADDPPLRRFAAFVNRSKPEDLAQNGTSSSMRAEPDESGDDR